VALQAVIRDWIIKFDENYVNRFEHRIADNGLACRSCGIAWKYGDFIHCQYKSRGPATKRHLACAIFHHVLSMSEAKSMAGKELEINYSEIQEQIDMRMKQRKTLLASWMYWMMAGGFVTFMMTATQL